MGNQTATIYSFTTIRTAAEAFKHRAPLTAAILEDEHKERFLAFLAGSNGREPTVGERVIFDSLDENGKPIYTTY